MNQRTARKCACVRPTYPSMMTLDEKVAIVPSDPVAATFVPTISVSVSIFGPVCPPTGADKAEILTRGRNTLKHGFGALASS